LVFELELIKVNWLSRPNMWRAQKAS
jgi:hypothetical protein